ncbi:hypothetical protein BD779DRAFT_1475549 [Infundibulicybe gibba]|nr:hypothetical protein BD779DRAFT_1475549 [Infundibulicybe gibba]
MSESSENGLSAAQSAALAQLRDVTGGADDEVSRGVLESVGWDVQKAADLIFDSSSGSAPTPAPPPPPVASTSAQASGSGRIEQFDIDDSGVDMNDQEDRQRALLPRAILSALARPFLTLVAIPLHILASVLRLLCTALRVPPGRLPFRYFLAPATGYGVGYLLGGAAWRAAWVGRGAYRPVRGRDTNGEGEAERWVRELEEETGAVCVALREAGGGTATGADVARGDGEGLVVRSTAAETGARAKDTEGRRGVLPPFVGGTYEGVLRQCESEMRVACIILVSEEHDDVREFKRSTLTDPAFVKLLVDNDMLVWGGDVRERGAWSAAEKLQATTFPFVAFIALQPRRAPVSARDTSTSSPPTLTVLSRHQGRSVPASAPTSSSTLVGHLETTLLPRVTPFLMRVRTQREKERRERERVEEERAREREWRREQERGYEEAKRRDEGLWRAKRERERVEQDQQREEREREQREEEERARREQLEEEERALREQWRRWMATWAVRRDMVAGGVRVAVRMPHGGRALRVFGPSETLTSLYAFVDVQLSEGPKRDALERPPIANGLEYSSPEETLEHWIGENGGNSWWGFEVVLAYPRKSLPWTPGTKIADVEALRGGAQVVVEMAQESKGKARATRDEDEDGYLTEESE